MEKPHSFSPGLWQSFGEGGEGECVRTFRKLSTSPVLFFKNKKYSYILFYFIFIF